MNDPVRSYSELTTTQVNKRPPPKVPLNVPTPPPRPSSGRNPLLEQMNPMPPGTYSKGDLRRVGREATFDPLRGAFVVLARPDDPEPDMPERRRGLRNVDSCREPGQIKALLVRGTEI